MEEQFHEIATTNLLIYDALLQRKNLSPDERQLYEQYSKGFAGESRLRTLLSLAHFEQIVPLLDCLFEMNKNEFQIDCLLLTTNKIY